MPMKKIATAAAALGVALLSAAPASAAGVRAQVSDTPGTFFSGWNSSRLLMCGPASTGQPQAAASIRFWPPSGAKLPPSNATSASA